MKYDYEKLEQMRLTDLREFARSIGVKKPSIWTKDRLIVNIIDVLEGAVMPVEQSRRGRPPIKPCVFMDCKTILEGENNSEKKEQSERVKQLVKKKIELVNHFNEFLDELISYIE